MTRETNVEIIEREECLTLIASLSVGRIAVSRPEAGPLVVPVNYQLDGEIVVFRTDPGTKLDWMHEAPVSFQVDVIDHVHRAGWSVLVSGTTTERTVDVVGEAGAESWAQGAKQHVIRIHPESVSGRRIRLPDIELDGRGYL